MSASTIALVARPEGDLDEGRAERHTADAFSGGFDVGEPDQRLGQFVEFSRGRANCSPGRYAGMSGALAIRQPSSARNRMSFTAPV